jgi:hypothetical protein
MLWLRSVRTTSKRLGTSIMIVGSAVIGACSDQLTATQLSTERLSPLLDASGHATALRRFPNAVKYRDAGHKPATGRSGSASLTLRALLGKNGSTDVEVTTGSLDDGTSAPGNLDKIQLKVFNLAGAHISTRNHNGLRNGGYANYTIGNGPRGADIQVQANVSAIDPNRVDVVTVRETVRLRPDVAVTEITAPSSPLVDVPAQIVAEIRELNGDVGARANCLLSVNGTPVGTGHGIWIDAGGIVSCSFTLRFPTAGRVQLAVALTNVAPGDFDTGNNVKEAEIVVADRATGFFFGVNAGEATERSSWRVLQEYTYGPDADGVTSSYRQFEETSAFEFPQQFGSISGSLPSELPFPITGISITHFTGGSTLLARGYDLTPDMVQDDATIRVSCAFRRELTDNNVGVVMTQICSGVNKFGDGVEYPFTSLFHTRNTSEITYAITAVDGEFHIQYADGTRSDQTWSNNYFVDQPRTVPAFGSDYRIRAEIPSSGYLYVNDATVTFTSYRTEYPDQPWTCTPWTDGFYRGQTCLELRRVVTGTFGILSGWGTVEPLARASPVANR